MVEQSERNFRSSYLEKVGIKGVGEKKSLEILLKERPLDKLKLIQFSLRFPLPAAYRSYVWKIILGVLPIYPEVHEFVWQQRRQQYEDLHWALSGMKKITEETDLPLVYLHMFLMEEGKLPFDLTRMVQEEDNKVFMSMAAAMAEIIEDPIEVYWLSKQLYRLHTSSACSFSVMVGRVEQFLKKEEPDGKLHAHLVKMRAFNLLPFNHWFKSCYADVLPSSSFERIWDKVVGGSCKILAFVAVAILVTLKHRILNINNSEDLLKYLSQIPEDSGDIIVSKSIELWHKYGSPLVPMTNRGELPNVQDKPHT